MESRPRSLGSTDRWDNGKKHQLFAGRNNARTLRMILVFNISDQKRGNENAILTVIPKHRTVVKVEC